MVNFFGKGFFEHLSIILFENDLGGVLAAHHSLSDSTVYLPYFQAHVDF